MKEPFFKPHIGEGFKNPANNVFGGLKILVLGHNHYCNTLFNLRKENSEAHCGYNCEKYVKECNSFTKEVVNEFISYCKGETEFKRFMNTYTKFANAISGYEKTPQEIWDNIAFYNFCQSAVSFDAEQPKSKDYEESEEAFYEILRQLKPNIILCWGFDKVYMNTPFKFWTSPNEGNLGFYTIEGSKIPMFYIHHPSWSGFSPQAENEKISEYIKIK